jgi:hypothetical protein
MGGSENRVCGSSGWHLAWEAVWRWAASMEAVNSSDLGGHGGRFSKNFETARTRNFRATELSSEDERTIGHIEEFGCSVVNVKRTGQRKITVENTLTIRLAGEWRFRH